MNLWEERNKFLTHLYLLHYNYWGKLLMKNSDFRESYVVPARPFPIFLFPSLLYLPTFP